MSNKLVYAAADILQKVEQRKNSLRNLVLNYGFKNTKQLYRLCSQVSTQQHTLYALLQSVEGQHLLVEPIYEQNTHLLLVLLYEAVCGTFGLKCSSQLAKPIKLRLDQLRQVSECMSEAVLSEWTWLQVKRILKYNKSIIMQTYADLSAAEQSAESKQVACVVPRYARVNTLCTDINTVHDQLQTEYSFTRLQWTRNTIKWKRYGKCVDGMSEQEYYEDPHVQGLLVFTAGTDLHAHPLVTCGALVLQDKASCLPVLCLDASPGSHVIDCCAAPGIKTFHLAALMNNKGHIHAFDRDQKRLGVMQTLMQQMHVTCASTNAMDFLRTDMSTDKRLAKAKYVLLDPPCSGSGIVSRKNNDNAPDIDKRRLASLANLQAMLLKHALKGPKVERLVYSTCSVHEEENEAVIGEVLADQSVTSKYELVQAMPEWTVRGLDTYPFGHLLLRAAPSQTRTNGFFVAVWQRKHI